VKKEELTEKIHLVHPGDAELVYQSNLQGLVFQEQLYLQNLQQSSVAL
jgi:hypothetical protein